jgi:hypothetical protein
MQRGIGTILLLALPLVATAVLVAQVPGFRSQSSYGSVVSGELPSKRSGFIFCRLVYNSVRREPGGSGWRTDYPLADRNLMIRLSELTLTPITTLHEGSPVHALIRATDDGLFRCPFLFASDVGTVGFSDAEARSLREYLLKGGFLWVDDFWGSWAWAHWLDQIAYVLPEYQAVELSLDHPIFSTYYFVEKIPQIPSIRHWRSSYGGTSERGAESARPRVWGIFDDRKNLLVLMSHNTDIADGWEREGEDWDFFHLFSPRGYAVGVNVAIWSMTH